MKLKKLCISLSASLVLSGMLVLSSFATPVVMPDGNIFDPEYYAAQNPDVAGVVGKEALALYDHYVNSGKAEGRLPFELNAGWINAALEATSKYSDTKALSAGSFKNIKKAAGILGWHTEKNIKGKESKYLVSPGGTIKLLSDFSKGRKRYLLLSDTGSYMEFTPSNTTAELIGALITLTSKGA